MPRSLRQWAPRGRPGPVSDPRRSFKSAWSSLAAGLRGPGIFSCRHCDRFPDARPGQRGRRPPRCSASLDARAAISDRPCDLLLLRCDRHMDRIRSGRAAIFRNVPLLRSGDECRDRADRLRRRRGYHLAMHSCRGGGWLPKTSCQLKTSSVPVDPAPAAEQTLVRFSDDAETRLVAV
jgi:hypothetical protein